MEDSIKKRISTFKKYTYSNKYSIHSIKPCFDPTDLDWAEEFINNLVSKWRFPKPYMGLTEFNNEIRLEWRVEGSLNKITLTISFRNHIKLLAVTQNSSREESLVFNLRGLSCTKDANQSQIYATENLMLGSKLVEIGEWLTKYLVSGISDLDTLARMYVSKILLSENYDKIEKIRDPDMKITVKSDSLTWSGTDYDWDVACFLASHHLLDRQ